MVPTPPQQIVVAEDAFAVSRDPVLLVAHLKAALAIVFHDDSQGIGGLLHLRYVATVDGKPVELTDNTLSSSVLLIDRFCKDMKKAGSRSQWWRVRIVGHVDQRHASEAATVLDLVRAYFIDSPKPASCQELKHPAGVTVMTHAREGQIWTRGLAETVGVRVRAAAG